MKTWDAVYQEWQTDDGQIHAQRMGLLIRCKDCKFYSTVYYPYGCLWTDPAVDRERTEVDFCSWGIATEEENDRTEKQVSQGQL